MRTSTRRKDVPKPTLAAVVTAQVRDRILDGTYPPGTQMNEVELATRFATSRGPVREALQRLVQDGLLLSAPHKGITVRAMTSEDLDDLYFARAALERAAVTRLTERGAPAALLATLEQDVRRMALAVDEHRWVDVAVADLGFHSHVVDAAGSERLSAMYASLADQTRLCLNIMLGTYKGRTELVDEHDELMRLLAAGDRDALLTALDRHFGDAMTTLHHHRHEHPTD
ncbi:GntR family transcriptional regulator [Actinophytocola sp.]|uniref:GntR family transcriptional regulator n=1 Tax=Actinophytocola sp. TaxID=1872138 RepID=UPI002ED525FE